MNGRIMIAILSVLALAAGPAMAAGKAGGGTLKLAGPANPSSLDPHASLSAISLQYSHWVFDPLVRWTRKMTLEPRLAVKWEWRNATTLRFTLRKGVTFHSGNPFTAKDVKWTVDRLRKSPEFKALFEPVAGATVIDDHTVDIATTRPYPPLPNLAALVFPMDSAFYTGTDENGQPKDAIVVLGPSFAMKHESGTGKYLVRSHEPGVRTVFFRFAEHWDAASPGNVDDIELTAMRNDDARVAALLSGAVDMILPVPPRSVERIVGEGHPRLISMTGGRLVSLQLNRNRRPEFMDPRIREAMARAIDNERIVRDVLKGLATAAAQQAPKGFAGHVDGLKPRFDLAKARSLMKDAGHEGGFECTMIGPKGRYLEDGNVAEAVVSMLNEIHVTVHLTLLPKERYWEQFDAQAADIQMIGWHPETGDGASYSEYLLLCPNADTGEGRYNSGNYCNPALDELVLAARTEMDPAKRADLLRRAERIAYEDAAFLPLHWENPSWAARKNVMLEPVLNAMDFLYLGDLVVK